MSPPLPPTAPPVLIEMLPLAPAVWESPVAAPFAAVAGGAASAGLHGHVAAVARCATCSGRQRHRAAVGCGANTCRDRHCAASPSLPASAARARADDHQTHQPMVSLPPVALLEVVLPAVSDMSPPAPVLPSPTFNVMSPPLPPTALPVLILKLPLAPAVWESPVASSICRCCRWCRQRRSSWTRRRCCQMCHLQRSTASSRRCRLRCQHLS